MNDRRKLHLQSTDIVTITSHNFGQWSGATELVDSAGNPVSGYTGSWAGEFFGNNAGSTAGTFSATGSANSDPSYLGAFMGTR